MTSIVMYWVLRFLSACFYCVLIKLFINLISNCYKKKQERNHAAILQAATRRKLSIRRPIVTPPRYYKQPKSARFKQD